MHMKKNKIQSALTAMGFAISSLGIASAQNPVSLPFECDFENGAEGWNFVQSKTDQWCVGTGAEGNESHAMYISNDNGATNSYDLNGMNFGVYAYFTVDIEEPGQYRLDFRCLCEGGDELDVMMVGISAVQPTEGSKINGSSTYQYASQWQNESLDFLVSSTGTQYVFFRWVNDGSGTGSGRAAAIDDVVFKKDDCPAPTNLSAIALAHDQVRLSWEAPDGIDDIARYDIQFRKSTESSWTSAESAASTTSLITGLSENSLYFFRVRSYRNTESFSNWTDGFCACRTPYACPAPENLSLAPEGETFRLDWETEAGNTIVYYAKNNEDIWKAVLANGNTFLFPELEMASGYVAKLRSFCGAGDTSIFSEEVSFTTPCPAQSVPFREDFDESSWIGGNLLCWTIIDANNDGKTFDFSASDGIDGSGCAMYRYSMNSPADDYLVSPQIDLQGREASVSFYIRPEYENTEKYSVLLSTTGTAVEDFTETLQEERLLSSTEFELRTFDLSAYTDEKVHIAIKASSDAFSDFFYIDDFSVTTCPAPANLALDEGPDSLLPTSARIAFQAKSGNATIEYKESSEEQWTIVADQTSPVLLQGLRPDNTEYQVRAKAICGETEESPYSQTFSFSTPYACPAPENLRTTAIQASSLALAWEGEADTYETECKESGSEAWIPKGKTQEKQIRIDSLSPQSLYDIRVRAICSQDEHSLWCEGSFLTPCQAMPFPYSEGFESEFTDNVPQCWTYRRLSGSNSPHWLQSASMAKEGEKSLMLSSESRGEAIMASPLLDFEEGFVYTLSFWAYRNPMALSEEEGVKFYIGPSYDTADAQFIAYIHNMPSLDPVAETESEDGWYFYRYNLPVKSAPCFLLLYGISGSDVDMFIDDLQVSRYYANRISAEICEGDTYPFGNLDLSQSGIYYDTIENAIADTLTILNLRVNPSYVFDIEETICEGDTLRIGDQTFTESGSHTVGLKTAAGCDSIYHIDLRIRQHYLFEIDTAICEGSSLIFGGRTYSESGEYVETYESEDGCDSVYHVILSVDPGPEPPVIMLVDSLQTGRSPYLIAATPEDSVKWYNRRGWIEEAHGKQYTPSENGYYHATAVNLCGESEESNKIQITLTAVQGLSEADAPAVYPNPATDAIHVQAQQDILLVRMHDQSGRTVMEAEGNSLQELTLPVSRLETGNYVLRVQTSSGWFTYKIVIR